MNEERKERKTTMAHAKKSPKRLSKFGLSLIIYSAVLLIAAGVGLGVFWSFLGSYDKSLPETSVNGYLSGMTAEKWHSIVSDDVKYDTNEFESPEVLYEKTVSAIAEGKISYVKNYESDEATAPSYFLVRDGKKFAEVFLKLSEEVGFGFKSWAVDRCAIIKEAVAVDPFAVTLMVPDGAEVKLNGSPLGESYITETGAVSHQMSKYDVSAETRPKCTLYTVDGFYFMPDAEAMLGDAALEITENGTLLIFDHPESIFTSATLTAPSNADVTLNGVPLDETPEKVVPLFSQKYESAEKTGITVNTYIIKGLSAAPEIVCKIGDRKIEPMVKDGVTDFAYPSDMLYTATVTVPKGAAVTVNGVAVESDAFKGSAVYGGFDEKSYSWRLGTYPECDKYEIAGLYSVPEVSVKIGDRELGVSEDTNGTALTFTSDFPAEGSAPTDVSDRAIEFSKAFLYYTSSGYYNLDANLNNALAYTLSWSEAYESILASRIGVYYNSCYQLSYKKIGVTEFTQYTDDLVEITVEFDADKTLGDYYVNDAGAYNIVMLRVDGVWYTVEFSMTAVSE